MLDGIFHGSGGAMAWNQGEVENLSPTTVAPSRDNIGMTVAGEGVVDGQQGGDFHGKVSLGILQFAIVGLILVYIWTRNVQGGG